MQFCEHNPDEYGKSVDFSTITTNEFTVTNGDSILLSSADTYSVKGKLAMSFSYDDSTKVYTLSVLKNNGVDTDGTPLYDVDTLTFKKDSSWDMNDYNGVDMLGAVTNDVEQFLWFSSALTDAQVTEVMAAVVPEPATATLSLLALAGLAARRRRK